MHFAFVALHHRASNGVLRSSFEFLIGFRTNFGSLGRYVTDGHTESNLRTSLRSSVYSVYYRTGRCRIKGVLQRPAGKTLVESVPLEKKKLVSTNSRKHRSYCVSSVTQSPHRLKSPLSAKLQRIIYAMPRTQSSDSATNSKQQVCTLSHRLANVFSNVKIKRSKVST